MTSGTPVATVDSQDMDEKTLFAVLRDRLYTPVVGDILDELGYVHQFLPAEIMPLLPDMKVAGRAMTVLMIDVFGPQEKPFGLLTEALDDLRPNEVYLAVGGAGRCAYWGELLTATARTRGAVGAVVDGYHRDTPQVLEQDWPVFSKGAWAQDSSVRTQVVDYRCPIEIGNVKISDGDVVFGDRDGVLIIPQQLAHEVVRRSLEKASAEKVVRKAIEGGMTATEAFRTYGVL
jgi:4-hydroxy-4-methyl-2-oxoglutarate aldolase